MTLHFVIALAPVTKKNSQQIVRLGKRYSIVPSKQYKAYEKAAMLFIPTNTYSGITAPVTVQALFYMPTRRRVDLTNTAGSAGRYAGTRRGCWRICNRFNNVSC